MNTVINGNQLENIGTPLSDVIISGNQLENTDVAGTVEVSSEDELALLNVPVGTVVYIIGGEAWQKNADGTWESYGSGGGGSSDFSTAEVTINNLVKSPTNEIIPLTVFMPVDDGNYIAGSVNLIRETSTYNVIIGKTKSALLIVDAESVTFDSTGNVTYIPEDNAFMISGNCSITIEAGGSN